MPPGRKPKNGRIRRDKLQESLRDKGREIRLEKFPPELQHVIGKRVVAAVKALHGFKTKKLSWGTGKKHGAVEIAFVPAYGYKSQTRTESGNEHFPNFRYFSADHIHGFKEWIGLAVRFMAYPSKAEGGKFRNLVRLDEVVWPHDFVMHEYGSIGNIGGTITFAANRSKEGTFAADEKPTFFLQSIKIRSAYYNITRTPRWIKDPKEIMERRAIKRRYEHWERRCIAEIEEQCRAIGFERIAWLPSSDAHFSRHDMRIQPDTREALYRKLPESRGYRPKTLWVPTNEGMREAQYYCKKLR